MRFLHTFIEFAKRAPRGYNADGRTLGLGLALAMEKTTHPATPAVERFHHHQLDVPHQRAA
jgi:hypothetical protein